MYLMYIVGCNTAPTKSSSQRQQQRPPCSLYTSNDVLQRANTAPHFIFTCVSPKSQPYLTPSDDSLAHHFIFFHRIGRVSGLTGLSPAGSRAEHGWAGVTASQGHTSVSNS